jgi:hypothetical protein
VRYFILNFVWRFVTDPITHACWAGLTGYFIGLAATGRHKWYTVAWIGLAAAAVLHGLNDWSRVNGHPVWILVVLVSGILFLGYAKVGSRGELHLFDGRAAFGVEPAAAGPAPGPGDRPQPAAPPPPQSQPRPQPQAGPDGWEH